MFWLFRMENSFNVIMMGTDFTDFSFWVKLIFPLSLILIAVSIGNKIGIKYREKSGLDYGIMGSVVGASLGLLAFMLAFTFDIAATRYDSRKQLFLDEVTSIRTAYMEAGLLKDTPRIACKKLLEENVDLRVEMARDPRTLDKVKQRTTEIHAALWQQAEALAREDRSSEIYALFTNAVSEVIGLQNRRVVVALQFRIPHVVLGVMYFIAFF